ncbi:MAG TPA: hypothetical protein VK615_17765 [Candidatus Binatia bacterium]|nr:hypothetical protein [Candidatus Binatia bacterium]
MKRVLTFAFAIVCVHQIMAQQEGINSKVIHNYTEFFVGYQYVDDFGADQGHGVVAHSSVDMNNFLFDVNGGYVWGDGADAWNAGGGLGYVVRLMRNHINIIPRFGMTYNKLEPENIDSIDTTTIEPGITLSFALNNWISVNGNYTYVRDVDFGKDLDAHTYGGGARIALTETLGLDVGARFADGQGFTSAFAGLSMHF